MFLIFSCWVISNFQEFIGEDFATRVYFILLYVAVSLIINPHKNISWFTYSFFEISIYNIFDEVLNIGDENQWYEIPIVLIIICKNYIKFNKKLQLKLLKMTEIFAAKAIVLLKGFALLLVTFLKIILAPIIILSNLLNDNKHQINYTEYSASMADFKFYAAKTFHTLFVSLINIKTAFTLLVIQALAFILPLKSFFHIIIFLVIVDTISALYALYKEKGNFKDFYESWTSRRAFDTIKKSVWYSVFGLVLFVIGSGLDEGEMMKKVALGVVGYIEGKSIIENIDKILGTNLWGLISDFFKERFLPKKD